MPKIKGKQIVDNTVTALQADETGTLSTINAGDAAVTGTATGLVRRDHQHAVATGTPSGTVEIADTGLEGSSSNLARADHVHPVGTPGAPVDVTKAAAAAGTSVVPARSDHKHDITTAAAVELTDATNAEGTATTLARSDHTHSHGNRSGGSLHSAATGGVNGFMSAVDKLKLDSLQDAAGFVVKESVITATTAAQVLGTDFENGDTIDGVVLTTGDRILIKDQASGVENGIYVVNVSGAPTRATDWPVGETVTTHRVWSDQGTANKDCGFVVTTDAPGDIVGTHAIVFSKYTQGSPRGAGAGLVLNGNDLDVVAADGSISVTANAIVVGVLQNDTMHGVRGGGTQHAVAIAGAPGTNGFFTGVDKAKLDGVTAGAEPNKTSNQEDVTTEAITGTDTAMTDTLNATPINSSTVKIYLNGVKQQQGAGKDYTVSGTTITWLASSGTAVDQETSDVMTATYLS